MKEILIVDDDRKIGAMLEQYLDKKGYLCTIIENGESAIRAILEKNFDIIILDLALPKLSGFEILNKLELIKPDSIHNTIAYTAQALTSKVMDELYRLGINSCLQKPIPLELLYQNIKEVSHSE